MQQLDFTFVTDINQEEPDFAFRSDGIYSAVYVDGAWRDGLSKFSCDINSKNIIGDLELKFNSLNIMKPTKQPSIKSIFELKIKNNITKIYVNGTKISLLASVNILAEIDKSPSINLKFSGKAPGLNIPWIKEINV